MQTDLTLVAQLPRKDQAYMPARPHPSVLSCPNRHRAGFPVATKMTAWLGYLIVPIQLISLACGPSLEQSPPAQQLVKATGQGRQIEPPLGAPQPTLDQAKEVATEPTQVASAVGTSTEAEAMTAAALALVATQRLESMALTKGAGLSARLTGTLPRLADLARRILAGGDYDPAPPEAIDSWADALANQGDAPGAELAAATREAAAAMAVALHRLKRPEAAEAESLHEAMAVAAPPTDRQRYTFTTDWFDNSAYAWGPRTLHLRGRPTRLLEIGSYEGASTTYILDELMSHPHSHLVAIDTFEGAMDQQPHPDRPDHHLETLFDRFWANVQRSARSGQIEVLRMRSDAAALRLRQEGRRFDFIYVDGSHTATDCLHDAVTLWPMLEVGGTMLFDDVDWRTYEQLHYCPGIAIESFLSCNRPEVRFAKDAGQMWVTRTPNEDTPRFFRH